MKIFPPAALLLLAAAAATAFAADGKPAAGQPAAHPHFDDQGTLSWSEKLADAQKAAKKEGKLIFIEYGRKA